MSFNLMTTQTFPFNILVLPLGSQNMYVPSLDHGAREPSVLGRMSFKVSVSTLRASLPAAGCKVARLQKLHA